MRISAFIPLLLFFLITGTVQAQDSLLVKWNVGVDRSQPGYVDIMFDGKIPDGWYLYEQNQQEGIEGIRILPGDTSLLDGRKKILIPSIKIEDPIFLKPLEVYKNSIRVSQRIKFGTVRPSSIRVSLTYELGDPSNFIPEEQKIDVILDTSVAQSDKAINRILIPSIDINNPVTDCGATAETNLEADSAGLGGLFFLGFLGGLVALLTPCVFPMIPLTVSFFTKKTANRKKGIFHAFMYGFFIFLIYILLSLPFHFLDSLNPDILNNISTNVYLNVFFFAIFIFFALSFFGFYEIALPSSFSNKADSKSGAGTLIGIFFMALTLALVSFSCTGPILGSLLAGSLSGDGGAMQLTMGMAGFGLALALPFALFALFPNWLNSLPKSGGWLTTVKVVLGFVELGLAFKFLSNADLVMHWGLLKREIFIGIWIVIGALLTLYLFGWLRFRHDSPIKKLHPFRLILAVATGLFTLYLLPGVTNTKYANLSLISGFPPPLYYSIYQQDSECLMGLNCTSDYETGLRMAREQNKPILLDFTGYACVNCRRMEENVWSRDEILPLMRDSFIVISLYVDDKKKLPINQQFTYINKEGIEREIKTVGDKWAVFETENFRNNAQPLYAILDTSETLLSHPVGYTPTIRDYKEWLECGVRTFKKAPLK